MKKMFITAMAVVMFMGSSAMAARVGETMKARTADQVTRLEKIYGFDVTKKQALAENTLTKGATEQIKSLEQSGARVTSSQALVALITSIPANARVVDNILSIREAASKTEDKAEAKAANDFADSLLVILENSAGLKSAADFKSPLDAVIKGNNEKAAQARAALKLLELSEKGLEMGTDATSVISQMVSNAKSKGGDFVTNLMKELNDRGIKLEDLIRCRV